MPARPRAVFLDRDDTLNVNAALPPHAFPATPGDLYLPEHVRLLPGVAEACSALKAAGFALVIVTNQGGVARGHAALADIDATNDRVRALIGDGVIDAAYVAPHHPDARRPHLAADHPWRKPGPGMILAAAADLGIDLERSWMIGDTPRDAHAAAAAGLPAEQCFVVGPGPSADFDDMPAAAAFILSLETPPPPEPDPAAVPVPATTVTLRAGAGRPLAGRGIRDTVESTARAIAERTGVAILHLACTDHAVTATLATHRLGAMGFVAELRRLTNAWHAARSDGRPLWPPGPRRDEP